MSAASLDTMGRALHPSSLLLFFVLISFSPVPLEISAFHSHHSCNSSFAVPSLWQFQLFLVGLLTSKRRVYGVGGRGLEAAEEVWMSAATLDTMGRAFHPLKVDSNQLFLV